MNAKQQETDTTTKKNILQYNFWVVLAAGSGGRNQPFGRPM